MSFEPITKKLKTEFSLKDIINNISIYLQKIFFKDNIKLEEIIKSINYIIRLYYDTYNKRYNSDYKIGQIFDIYDNTNIYVMLAKLENYVILDEKNNDINLNYDYLDSFKNNIKDKYNEEDYNAITLELIKYIIYIYMTSINLDSNKDNYECAYVEKSSYNNIFITKQKFDNFINDYNNFNKLKYTYDNMQNNITLNNFKNYFIGDIHGDIFILLYNISNILYSNCNEEEKQIINKDKINKIINSLNDMNKEINSINIDDIDIINIKYKLIQIFINIKKMYFWCDDTLFNIYFDKLFNDLLNILDNIDNLKLNSINERIKGIIKNIRYYNYILNNILIFKLDNRIDNKIYNVNNKNILNDLFKLLQTKDYYTIINNIMYQKCIKIYILGDALDPFDNSNIRIYEYLLRQLFINENLQIPQLDIYSNTTYILLQNQYYSKESCFYDKTYNDNIKKLLEKLYTTHYITEERYNDLKLNYMNTYNKVFNYYNSLCYLTNLFIYNFFENKGNTYSGNNIINKYYIKGNHDIPSNYIIKYFNFKDNPPLNGVSDNDFYNRLNMIDNMYINNKFYISHAGYIIINNIPIHTDTLYTELYTALINSNEYKLNNLLSVDLLNDDDINIKIPFQIIGHTRTLHLPINSENIKVNDIIDNRIDELRKLFLKSSYNNNINIHTCDFLNTFYNNYNFNNYSKYYIEYIDKEDYITVYTNEYTNENPNGKHIINIENQIDKKIGGFINNLIKSNNNLQIQNHINNIKKYFDNINNLLFVNLLSIIDYEFFILLLARICYDVKFLNNLINNNNKSLLSENKNILKNEIKSIEHLFVSSKKDRLINNLSKNNSKKIYVGGLLDNIMKNKIIQFNNKEDVVNYLIQLYNITDNNIINNLNELVNLLNKIDNNKLKMMLLNIFNNEKENKEESLLSRFTKLFL